MPKQTELPGTERPVNKRVETAGEKYVEKLKAAASASSKRKDAKLELIRVMREEKVEEWIDFEAQPKPLVVRVAAEDKVTVSPYKGKVDNDDEVKAKKKSKMRVVRGDADGETDGDEIPN